MLTIMPDLDLTQTGSCGTSIELKASLPAFQYYFVFCTTRYFRCSELKFESRLGFVGLVLPFSDPRSSVVQLFHPNTTLLASETTSQLGEESAISVVFFIPLPRFHFSLFPFSNFPFSLLSFYLSICPSLSLSFEVSVYVWLDLPKNRGLAPNTHSIIQDCPTL